MPQNNPQGQRGQPQKRQDRQGRQPQDARLHEYTGVLNICIYVQVLAANEADAMEQLGRLDLDAAYETAPYFDIIQDDQGRYFYALPQPLPREASDGEDIVLRCSPGF